MEVTYMTLLSYGRLADVIHADPAALLAKNWVNRSNTKSGCSTYEK